MQRIRASSYAARIREEAIFAAPSLAAPGLLPIQTAMLLDELTMITGEHFEPDYALTPEQQTAQRVTRAKAWVAEHATHFTPGSLYKYGHKQDIAAIF